MKAATLAALCLLASAATTHAEVRVGALD